MNDSPSEDRVALLLSNTLNGDISQINELRQVSQAKLHTAGKALGDHLTFGRPTVLRVLQDWREGRVSEEQVRWWALLMFTGGFPDESRRDGSWHLHFSSSQPIHIDYSEDESVNEVVFRLKDLGDPFEDNGWIVAEREAMISELSH